MLLVVDIYLAFPKLDLDRYLISYMQCRMQSYPNSRPASPTELKQLSSTWSLLASWVISVTVRILALTSALGGEPESKSSFENVPFSGVGSSQLFILVVVSSYPSHRDLFLTVSQSLLSIIYTVQHLLMALENSPGRAHQPPINKTRTLLFVIFRLALVFWLVTMIACSVVSSKPCMKRGLECNLLVMTVVASALAE